MAFPHIIHENWSCLDTLYKKYPNIIHLWPSTLLREPWGEELWGSGSVNVGETICVKTSAYEEAVKNGREIAEERA